MINRNDEVLETFKRFKMLVENQSEKKIKVLRTNRGGECMSKMFEDFYAQHDIDHEVTAP